MEGVLREIFQRLQQSREMLIVALILARTMPMVVQTPFLGGKLVPNEVKMGLGIMITILVWPLARPAISSQISTAPFGFFMLMMKEVFIGFMIGFVNSHVYDVLDMAGRSIDTVRGTSMSEVMDPHSQSRITPVGNFYTQIFLVLFTAMGGHRIFLQMYFETFVSLPLDKSLSWEGPNLLPFFDDYMKSIGEVWMISFVLAAPIVAATFITDIVFGILNRVAPQLNAYFMAMPVKAMAGVLMILVSIHAIMARFNELVVWSLKAVQDTLILLFA